MDLSKVSQYWHLLEAARTGETIQIKSNFNPLKWEDMVESNFTLKPEQYRVKPKEPSKLYLVWCFNSLTTSKRWVMVNQFMCDDDAVAYVNKNKLHDKMETRKYYVQEVVCPEPNDYFQVFNKEKV